MVYRPDNSGSFVGLERVSGRVGGRSGSFVLQHTGTFDKTDVNGTFFVVPQSGTGELVNLHGEGSISLSGHAERYPMVFNFNWIEAATWASGRFIKPQPPNTISHFHHPALALAVECRYRARGRD